MHISDTLIDAASGAIVVPGELQTALPVPGMPEIIEHQHLLLDFSPLGLRCRAVSRFDRLPSGLLNVSTIDACLQFSHLSRQIFDDMLQWSTQPNTGKMQFAGDQCGSLVVGPHGQRIGVVTAFEIFQSFDSTGRVFRIEGAVIPAGALADSPLLAQSVNRFSLCGTIPWVTLRILGFARSDGYRKYLPKAPERPGTSASPVPRVVSSVADLRSTGHILGSLTDPTHPGSDMLLAGSIELTSQEKATRAPASQVVVLNLSERALAVADADRALLHSDGFCSLRSDFSFDVTCLNASFVSDLFGTDGTHVTATMSGSGLGRVNYNTGLGRFHGDPLGRIRQDIMLLELATDLTLSGIEIHVAGRLREFQDDYAKEYRAMFEKGEEGFRRSYEPAFAQTMKPWSGFSIRAVIPWMWLLIRRSALAKRTPTPDTGH